MDIKLTNVTANSQQIMIINGEGIIVEAGKETTINTLDVYAGELIRLKAFFKIEEVQAAKEKIKKVAEPMIATEEKFYGGNE